MFETTLTVQMTSILMQGFVCFILAMALTPVYTHFAFKFKAWKQIRTDAMTGEKAPVY